MANYSKESKRQNDVLQDLISGKEHHKNYIQVGYMPTTENLNGKTRQSKLTDIMKDVRMPWFCPKCDKIMKNTLDNKMWRLYGNCFDCQVKFENELRINGKYEEWEKNKIKQNKIAFIKDSIQKIEEWKKQSNPEWYNNVGLNYPELEKETWAIDKDAIVKEADEALKKYNELLIQLEKE